MGKQFNGQINISRDLRKNKQVVIGKYDITDIIFLLLGFGSAFIVAYILGFSLLKIVDEFTAIIISIFPMILIISLGFKRVAGIRQFNFILMKHIDKKSKVRFNRINDKTQNGEKYIVGFLIDEKYVSKYMNEFLSYDNLVELSVRYEKDENTNQNKIYFILDLRYKKNEDIFIDLIKKFSLNTEITGLSYTDLINLQSNLNKKFDDKNNKRFTINETIKQIFNNLHYKKTKKKINDEVINEDIKNKNYKIYMLNLYDTENYKKFIKEVIEYADVVTYFKVYGTKKYVNTFLLVEDEQKKANEITKLENIEKLCTKYLVVVDKLNNDQAAARYAISYSLTNPFNAYRIYE